MQGNYLILGSTGSIGYAFTTALLAKHESVTILVRRKKKALKLFDNSAILHIVEGDVRNRDLLNTLASEANYIFHGINYPYHKWDMFMEPVTGNVIDAASQNNSILIFPGNIYSFGNVDEEIKETTVPVPVTKKGKLRWRLIQLLKNAADEGKCKIIILRLPDFWGPNVLNGLIKPIFRNAAKNKPIEWLIDADIPHQFVYTPDAAQLMLKLCRETEMDNFTLYNYGGTVITSMRSWAREISSVAGSPDQVKVIPKFILQIAGIFSPVVKELKENFYQFENSIILNDEKIRAKYPDFKPTPMTEAISETIDWFRTNV